MAGAEDGGVVLAAAEGSDAFVADEGAEGLAVFRGAEVAGEIFVIADVLVVFTALAQVVGAGEREEHRDDNGAGAGEASGLGEIGGDGEVDSFEIAREIACDPADDGGGIVGPVAFVGCGGRSGGEIKLKRHGFVGVGMRVM